MRRKAEKRQKGTGKRYIMRAGEKTGKAKEKKAAKSEKGDFSTGLKIKSPLNKRPYGLLESAGIYSGGMTPGEAWAEWNAHRAEERKEKQRAEEERKKRHVNGYKTDDVARFPDRYGGMKAKLTDVGKDGRVAIRITEGKYGTMHPGTFIVMSRERFTELTKEAEKEARRAEKRAEKEKKHRGLFGRNFVAKGDSAKKIKNKSGRLPGKKAEFTSMRYAINEDSARHAKEMTSFFDYKDGSATKGYEASVSAFDDKVNKLFKAYKDNDALTAEDWARARRVAESYGKKLADSTNRINEIEGRYPSWFIAGPSKYNVGKHEKKMRALDNAYKDFPEEREYLNRIQGILSNRAVAAGDENAVGKLEKKLQKLQKEQEERKALNAYYRKNKTLSGAPGVTEEAAKEWEKKKARGEHMYQAPVPAFDLSNRSAEIRRLKARIESLNKEKADAGTGKHEYPKKEGVQVVENAELMRVQLKFDDRPTKETIEKLKKSGFRWSPSQGAWQRNLNENGRYAVKKVLKEL